MTIALEERTRLSDVLIPHFIPKRYRPGNLGTWSGHLSFANDLIASLRPSLLVELGTHWGESYFTFCQSVFENGLDCVCYAVDHWLGEAHAGTYGEEVYQEVQDYNEAQYRSFSYLLRTGFEDALPQFSNESIDLLHIDGLHTFEAVAHDFYSWLPKVKPGGIVMLHDIAVRHADFGVWRLWDRLKAEFDEVFEFHHWWGLGVLRKRGGTRLRMPFLEKLFVASPEEQERIRRYYFLNATYFEMLHQGGSTLGSASEPALVTEPLPGGSCRAANAIQVYPFGENGYSEETSSLRQIEPEVVHEISFDLPNGMGSQVLRIDPANKPGLIEIFHLSVLRLDNGQALWDAATAKSLSAVVVTGTAERVASEESLFILSLGADPQCFLPPIALYDGPVRVEITMRMHDSVSVVFRMLKSALERHQATLTGELRLSQSERMLLAAEMKQIMSDRNDARRELRVAADAIQHARSKREQMEHEIDRLNKLLEQDRSVVFAMQRSLSWKATAPIRSLMSFVRRGARS